jgi:hypothetical protein
MGSLSDHVTRRVNALGFDHEVSVKRNLPIVNVVNAVHFPDGTSVLIIFLNQSIMIQPIIHSCQNFIILG